jgi:LysR family transcriptional regulator for bpeEF and oprC
MQDAHDLRAFVEVARSGSFHRAATSMGQTKSAVSKAIARLEDRLGIRLVVRTTRQLTLTEEGRSYLADCEDILGSIEAANDRVRLLRVRPAGTVRVEFPLLWGREQIVPLLPEFRRDFPDIALQLLFADSRLARHDDFVDVRVIVGPCDDPSFISNPLLTTRAITVASPGYLAQAGIPHSPDDLLRHTCVHYFHPTTRESYPWLFKGDRKAVGRRLSSPLMVSYPDAMRDAALAGIGIVQGPDFLFSEGLASGRLRQVLEEFATAGPTISVAWRQNKYLAQRVRILIDWLRKAARPA